MKPDHRRRPVAVEDLLRLKRAEKPNPEFWTDWEQRFKERRRQVEAEPRVWWKEALPQLGIAVARWHVPLGAAAVVALTFFAVREYNPTEHMVGSTGGGTVVTSAPLAGEKTKIGSADVLGELRRPAASAPTMVASAELRPGDISSALAGMPADDRLSPTERAIAANLAAVQALEPELAHSWRGRSLVPPAVTTGANALNEEPLANVAVARDFKRGRMLGYGFQPATASEFPAYSRQQERMISRLNENQLYEAKLPSVGARGDRLSVRF